MTTLGAITLLSTSLFTSGAAIASSSTQSAAPAAAPAGYFAHSGSTAPATAARPAADPALVSASSCSTGRIAISGIPAGALLFVRAAPNTTAPLATTSAPNGSQYDCIAIVPGEAYSVCGVTGNGWVLIPLFRPPTDVGFAPASCFIDV